VGPDSLLPPPHVDEFLFTSCFFGSTASHMSLQNLCPKAKTSQCQQLQFVRLKARLGVEYRALFLLVFHADHPRGFSNLLHAAPSRYNMHDLQPTWPVQPLTPTPSSLRNPKQIPRDCAQICRVIEQCRPPATITKLCTRRGFCG
jgi:hypothetical protein